MSEPTTLSDLLDNALDERNVTPERRAEYHQKLSRLVLVELAEYQQIKEEAAEWARRKEGRS